MSLLCRIHSSLFRKTLILGDYLNYFVVIDSLGDLSLAKIFGSGIKRKFSGTNRKALSYFTRSPFPFYCPFVPSTKALRELVITSLFEEDPSCLG